MSRDGLGSILRRPIGQAALILLACVGSTLANTRIDSSPRYDGAGYAVLAKSLLEGRGYREIDHPDAPLHAHFPPGYPLALAAVWALTGPSAASAHGFSLACTALATLIAWRFFLRGERPSVALLMALALAMNWRWSRDGAAIRSEPLFALLGLGAVLYGAVVADRGGAWRGLTLGVLLGLVVLTRHVGAMVAVAVFVDLILRGRRREAMAAMIASAVVVSPWIAWLAMVRTHTQIGLMPVRGLGGVVLGNFVFYGQRLIDTLIGPVIEVATVFRPRYANAATLFAFLAATPIVMGWFLLRKRPERRMAGLIPTLTMALLLAWPFTEAGRFLVPLVPFVIVGAVEGIAAMANGWRLAASCLVLTLSIPYAAYAIATDRAGAERATHAEFDAACLWIATQDGPRGPVLTRHPGEVFWLTGRTALAPREGGTVNDVGRLIQTYKADYLLVDDERFALAAASPLGRFAQAFPDRVQRAFTAEGPRPVIVYRVGGRSAEKPG